MRRVRDNLYLLLVLIGAVAFYAWERIALLSWTPIHTISYWAHQYIWLRILIAVVLPIVFGVWFWIHSSQNVPK